MKIKLCSDGGYNYWCPGCEEHHHIRTKPNERSQGWSFDGNEEFPTFNPSIKITGKKCVVIDGEWTGDWWRDDNGKAIDMCCHHFLHAGKLIYLNDCTHDLAGKTVDLPDLPRHNDD